MKVTQAYIDVFLNWQTLLDIILIAAGMFFLYRTFLRLGTWKILIGMLAAFIVFLFASLLNLEGIEWIFKNVGNVTLLGLIIIFQPELRKIFEKLVSHAVSSSKKHDNTTFEIIAESLTSLAEQKQGAIVVFPGKEQIQEKISGGFQLDAIASKPLLLSIFDHNSPGHDGAVIVANNMLTHFGVRLPISTTSMLSSDFGTRHHAAMGMSEQTDSLVLLVSEERGHVSSFVNGKMKRMYSSESIVDEIENHFSRSGLIQIAQKTNVSRRTSIQILCSFLLATIFWSTLILSEKQMIERTIHLPIEYTSPGEGLIFLGNKANELVVYAAGPKSAMDDFALSDPRAVVDLSKLAEGSQSILITNENIRHPKDVTLLDISPAEIELKLARIAKATATIIPQMVGQLPDGLKIKKVEIIPKELEVLAPHPLKERKGLTVSTMPIYLNTIRSSSNIASKIIAPPSFQPVDKRWPDVEVLITIE